MYPSFSLNLSFFSVNSKAELGIQRFFQHLLLFWSCEHCRAGQSISWYCSLLSNSLLNFACLLFCECLMVRAASLLAGLPELLDKCWWIKSFFHCEPSPPTVGRKALSASSTNSWIWKQAGLLSEILRTDLFFQEAWDLLSVWIQLKEENKTFRREGRHTFKRCQ